MKKNIKNQIQQDLKEVLKYNLSKTGVKPQDHLYLSLDMGAIFTNYINNPDKITMINKNKIFFTKYNK